MSQKTNLQEIANAIKTKKGDDTPIKATDFAQEIENLPSGELDTNFYGLIDDSITGTLVIPYGVTKIRGACFREITNIKNVEIPNSVMSIGTYAFTNSKIENVVLPTSITSIGSNSFNGCGLKNVVIPNSVTSIGSSAFMSSGGLTSLEIPSSVTTIGDTSFNLCSNLVSVVLGDGFNANGLKLSGSTKLTAETIIAMLESLYDRTELTTYTLNLGVTNLAKLTTEQIAVATEKNWTLV